MRVRARHYPELGMRVALQDRSLRGDYAPAATRELDPTSALNPKLLAQRGDLVAMEGGLAVFPTLPPRSQRLEVGGVVARSEGGADRASWRKWKPPVGRPICSRRAGW